ncbi:MAG: hypothetical protein WCV72_04065 [Patescibacteria group bacterium]|jgi:hypothetical protein
MVEEVITTATAEKPDFFEAIRKKVLVALGIPPIPAEIIEQYKNAGHSFDTAVREFQDMIKTLKGYDLYNGEKQEMPPELETARIAYYQAQADYNQAARMFGPNGRFAQRNKFKNLKWWA